MSSDAATGRCLCGAVRFEVDRPLRDIVVCHCSLCRRAGTNANAYTWAPVTALHLVDRGSLEVYVDANGRERSFCRTCGASLFWAEAGSEGISISAGALDDTGLRVARHIHADSTADWETLPGDVPVHHEGSASPIVSDPGE